MAALEATTAPPPVGDAPTIIARLRQFQRAGVDAVLVKLEGGTAEADRFAAQVVRGFA